MLRLAWNVCPANPPMNGGGVPGVFIAELGGEILLFRRYQDIVAGDKGRQKKDQRPREIDGQGDPRQSTNNTKIKRIPGNRENAGRDDLACWIPRIGSLTVLRKLPARQDDEGYPRDNEGSANKDEGWREESARE